MNKKYLLLFFLLATLSLYSQPVRKRCKAMTAKNIAVGVNGIQALSANNTDSIVTEVRSNKVLYCLPDSAESFWFKLFIKDNCDLSLSIFPSLPGNSYNFFLYKTTGNISAADVEASAIKPIRANLFKDDMFKVGTGLSMESKTNTSDADSAHIAAVFYHTPYHSAVHALKGEIYFLNIYHVKGKDCGFHFTLKDNNHSQLFESIYPGCYAGELKKMKTVSVINSLTPIVTVSKESSNKVKEKVLPEKEVETEAIRMIFSVKDSVTKAPLEAEITWQKKYNKLYTISKEKGKYEFYPERNVEYQVMFSAVGYKSKTVTVSAKGNLINFQEDVNLSPYVAGDNFVMEKIYFYPNTYNLKPGAVSELDKLISFLKANPSIVVEIQGHTSGNNRIKASKSSQDEEGSFTGSSKKLSQLRADLIKSYLIRNGISAFRLTAIGYGGSQMIYPDPKNQMEANKNIRVSVLILSGKSSALTSRGK